jgi:hypothetical protein
MRFRVLALACAVTALGVTAATAREPKVLTEAQSKAFRASAERQRMLFFVAKGAPNACGPGCSEWIAAEGIFEPATSQRFKDFLAASPSRRDLPIFFNSDGGDVQQSLLMAVVLREHRMRAGVARTLPEGCSGAITTDQACRRLVQSKDEVKAKLLTKGTKCGSACGYAFVGASSRQVANDARFYIHSAAFRNDNAASKAKDWFPLQRQLFVYLGIDPGWMDLINSVPFDRPRAMSRDEIARFGIETRGIHETQWFLGKKTPTQSQPFWISKSVTQPQGPGSSEYRTTTVFIGCPNRWGVPFSYRRELSKNEGNGRATLRFSGAGLELSPRPPEQDTEIKFTSLSTSQLRQAAAEPAIELSEQLWLQGEYRPRVTKLSTAGLSQAFEELLRLCDEGKVAAAVPAPTVPVRPPNTSAPAVHAVARDEAPWVLHTDTTQQYLAKFSLRKSISQAEVVGGVERRTTTVVIACPDWWGLPLTFRRELSANEGRGEVSIRLGDRDLEMRPVPHTAAPEKDVELRSVSLSIDLLKQAAAKSTIEIAENLSGEIKPRVITLSTAGLAAKFDELVRLCDASRRPGVFSPPAEAVAR